jgi:hypothetical protein
MSGFARCPVRQPQGESDTHLPEEESPKPTRGNVAQAILSESVHVVLIARIMNNVLHALF